MLLLVKSSRNSRISASKIVPRTIYVPCLPPSLPPESDRRHLGFSSLANSLLASLCFRFTVSCPLPHGSTNSSSIYLTTTVRLSQLARPYGEHDQPLIRAVRVYCLWVTPSPIPISILLRTFSASTHSLPHLLKEKPCLLPRKLR